MPARVVLYFGIWGSIPQLVSMIEELIKRVNSKIDFDNFQDCFNVIQTFKKDYIDNWNKGISVSREFYQEKYNEYLDQLRQMVDTYLESKKL